MNERTFLLLSKDNHGTCIKKVIRSQYYPSTYTVGNTNDRIVELPDVKEGQREAGCCIYLP